ncbi:hypothetical protein [Microbacterium sp.]|uniref:hypothetical protein n=1 Tax=Microbacterium sp. TaxID=51671 RepID=UPI00334063BC
MKHLITIAAVAAALLTATLASPASADEVAVDPEIAAVMAEVPGGVLLDPHHAVWPALDMEMLVPAGSSARESSLVGMASAQSVGSCATGRFCAFSAAKMGGAQLSWGTCTTVSVSSFTPKSIANARSSGYVQALSGSTVLATANAGASANVFGSASSLRCVP